MLRAEQTIIVGTLILGAGIAGAVAATNAVSPVFQQWDPVEEYLEVEKSRERENDREEAVEEGEEAEEFLEATEWVEEVAEWFSVSNTAVRADVSHYLNQSDTYKMDSATKASKDADTAKDLNQKSGALKSN